MVIKHIKNLMKGTVVGCMTYFTAAFTSSYEALFSSRQVKSTTDTLGAGTRKAIPVSFPFSSGRTLPTACSC